MSPLSATTADLNADGKVDIVSLDYNEAEVIVFLGNGNGTFAAEKAYTSGLNVVAETITDFNGDGKPDIASGFAGGVAVSLGNGDGTFALRRSFISGVYPSR